MSFWTKIRDGVIKPALAVAAAPATGGASLAALAIDQAAPPGALDFNKGSTRQNIAAAVAPQSPAAPPAPRTILPAPRTIPPAALWAGGAALVLAVGYFLIKKKG